ncbi:hypothetical protein [Bradyrhizobium sp. AZCC 2230]|uniref:hypothetical protein n=1 Tax=Bradyrhizobium sp. AZCC 2230 TaxID=3117021 RepID=UPI002FEEA7A7
MPEVTGTLAQQFELVSDTPTDINVISLRFALAVKAIEIIGKDLAEKLAHTSDPVLARKLEDEAAALIEGINRELACLLEAKRRWEAARNWLFLRLSCALRTARADHPRIATLSACSTRRESPSWLAF